MDFELLKRNYEEIKDLALKYIKDKSLDIDENDLTEGSLKSNINAHSDKLGKYLTGQVDFPESGILLLISRSHGNTTVNEYELVRHAEMEFKSKIG